MPKTKPHPQHRGIPKSLSLKKAKEWVEPRVSKKRFKHILGVQEVGRQICRELDPELAVDSFLVELACILHDACKEIKAEELKAMALDAGMKLTAEEKENGHILHGPVAAIVARQELGVESEPVLAAISEHTLGSVKMTTVSKVVYLADALEESRPEALTEPVWKTLGTTAFYRLDPADNQKEKPSAAETRISMHALDRAVFIATDLVLMHLLRKGKLIHPRAVAVRNHFLRLTKSDD